MPRRTISPPARCTGTSKRSGKQCRKWALPGSPAQKCYFHSSTGGRNGKGEALATADAHVTLATFLSDDPRPVELVLQDALHSADSVQQAMRQKVERGEDVSAEDVAGLIEASKLAFSLANALTRTGIAAKLAEIKSSQTALMAAAQDRALARVQLSVEQKAALSAAFAAELGAITAGMPDESDATVRAFALRALGIEPPAIEAEVVRDD